MDLLSSCWYVVEFYSWVRHGNIRFETCRKDKETLARRETHINI